MKPIQLYVSEDVHKQLKLKALQEGTTISDLLRFWIIRELESTGNSMYWNAKEEKQLPDGSQKKNTSMPTATIQPEGKS